MRFQRQAADNGWITDAERLDRMAKVGEEIATDPNASLRDRLSAQRAATSTIRAKVAVAPDDDAPALPPIDLSRLDERDLDDLERIARKLADGGPAGDPR